MENKKILMVSCSQFGYHTDMTKYCEYLEKDYDIYYFSQFQENKIIEDGNITTYYFKRKGKKFLGRIEYLKVLKKYIKDIEPDYIIVDYFLLSSLINFISKKSINILDFRTGSISKNNIVRNIKNYIMHIEAKTYRNVIVISQGLKDKLKLNSINTKVIPLGADAQVEDEFLKTEFKESLNLLYVGVLTGRKILDTLKGFNIFINKYKDKVDCKYSIIGYGKNKEDEEEIINYINENHLEKYVHFYGRIENSMLKKHFYENNIGVSYVPLYDYYQVQPPTKTFEYLKNGMICIATDTIENRRVINDKNGVLIQDNPEAFFKGIEVIYKNIKSYSRYEINKSVDEYSWSNIVNNLKLFIESL